MSFIGKNLNENARKWEYLEEEFDLDVLENEEVAVDEDEEEVVVGEDEDDDEAAEEPEGEEGEGEEDEEDEEGEEGEEGEGEEGEEDGESGIGDEYEGDTDALYKRVQGLLGNDIFNHASILERLWGSKGGTNRSKFRKKLKKEKTKDGYEYAFKRQELSDILAIIGKAGSEAVSAYQEGRKRKRAPVSDK